MAVRQPTVFIAHGGGRAAEGAGETVFSEVVLETAISGFRFE